MWKLIPLMNHGRFVGYSLRSIDHFPSMKFAWLGPFLVHEYGSKFLCQQAAHLHAGRHESPANTIYDMFVGTYEEFAVSIEMKLVALFRPALLGKYETQPSKFETQAFEAETQASESENQAPEPEACPYFESPSPCWLPNIAILIYFVVRLCFAYRAGYFG